jgi:hypothetical protein
MEALERRLNKVYQDALDQTVKEHQDFLKKLADKIKEGVQPSDSQLLREKWYRDQIMSISNDLAHSGQLARDIINGARFTELATGYSEMYREIGVSFNLFDKNTLSALYGDSPYLGRAFERLADANIIAERLTGQLATSLVKGESIRDIAKGIQATTERSLKQSIVIARTETIRARNTGRYINLEQAKNSGIKLTKVWEATGDDRTRDEHSLMDGEEVEVDELFSNGLMFPGDPNGEAEEVINCRCRVKAKVDKSYLKGAD